MLVGKELGEWFELSVGTRQGDPISPTIFISYLERVMVVVKDNNTGILVQGILFNNLNFADDIDLLKECRDKLQDNLRIVDEASKAAGLKVNINKTKTMVSGGSRYWTEQLQIAAKWRMSQSLCIWAVC